MLSFASWLFAQFNFVLIYYIFFTRPMILNRHLTMYTTQYNNIIIIIIGVV